MPESLKEKILYALELQKYLTIKQLTRLIGRGDPKAWERIRKSVQRLKKGNLLVSKAFDLGEDHLVCLADNPIIHKLGYSPPNKEIHPLFYEHEIIRGDAFVSAALSGHLLEWEWEPVVKKFVPDVLARFSDPIIYIEVERGKQNKAKLIKKIENYLNLFRETRETFYVLFIVADDLVDLMERIFEEMNLPQKYMFVTANAFIQDVLNAPLMSRKMSHTLSQLIPTDETQ